MINIISTCANSPSISGPQKVYANLIKGLTKIGYPYVINKNHNATHRLWIHDDHIALKYLRKSKAFKVIGPNLFVLPDQIPKNISFDGALYLVPSEWVKKLWMHLGFSLCPIAVWPVGIDTDTFQLPAVRHHKVKLLIYHKQRNKDELTEIISLLQCLQLPFQLIEYPLYQERDFLELLKCTSFVIWHGCHESQGIALQEVLACNIPILVCDATTLLQQVPAQFDVSLAEFPVTSAPYFDESCGVKITDISFLKSAIEFMLDNLKNFSPRKYVLKHLSLGDQAKAFVDLWEHWGLTFKMGLKEDAKNATAWRYSAFDRVLSNFIPRLMHKFKLGRK